MRLSHDTPCLVLSSAKHFPHFIEAIAIAIAIAIALALFFPAAAATPTATGAGAGTDVKERECLQFF